MKSTTLSKKIKDLPEDLKKQVLDYIDLLLYRYHDSQTPLTTEEKVALDQRWEAYQQDISSASDLEDVKNRMAKKYIKLFVGY